MPINNKILTISIPTYNRSKYLQQSLKQLKNELKSVGGELVEVLVSDNHSIDDTQAVVESFISDGFPIAYYRNDRNLGWGPNFFQCFNLAKGKYVLLLGDDDVLVDGALQNILNRIQEDNYGLVCVRAYGFNFDFRKEFPGLYGTEKMYENVQEFLLKIGPLITMISSCIVNKDLIKDVDTEKLFSENLAAMHLALLSSLAAKRNFFIDKPLVGCLRNNSSSYNFSAVFVNEFWSIIDSYKEKGIEESTIKSLEKQLLFSYYPIYLLYQRKDGTEDYKISLKDFKNRFEGQWRFNYWLKPIMTLPKPLGLGWAVFTTIIGRICGGELKRGIKYLQKSIFNASR